MARPTTVHEVGSLSPTTPTVLVAVDNPDHAAQLLRTARDLANRRGGTVHVVCVVSKAQDSPFGVFEDETIATEFDGGTHAVLDRAVDAGRALDLDVSGRVVVANSVHGGVIGTAEAVSADAVLIGWSGSTDRANAVLGTNVDAVIERAPQDVFVERIGAVADGVNSVLVPVAGGPHATLAAEAGHAIAIANGAGLTLLSVAGGETDRATARDRIATTIEDVLAVTATEGTRDGGERGGAIEDPAGRLGVVVDRRVVASDDVVGAITDAATDHDLVVLGATRSGHHRARIVSSIPRAVAERSDRTILLARKWTGPSRLTRVLDRISWH